MGFVIGVLLFAVGLLLSIAWHECGHMWAAQRTGMLVRRYFIGFGPTLWSVKRGETEYGIKAIPLGGFCDIAGMTTYDEIAPQDAHRAMYLQKAWKRFVVMIAGPMQNFILGFVLIVILALTAGLPDLSPPPPTPATVAETACVSPTIAADGTSPDKCTGIGPAEAAGLRTGDKIIAANGTPVSLAKDLSPIIQKSTGPVTLTVERAGAQLTVVITPQPVQLTNKSSTGVVSTETVNQIGIKYPQRAQYKDYNVLTAVPGSVMFTGQLAEVTWDSLLSLPTKIGALWTSVTGGERAADTPISVYGASVIGGDAAEAGNWAFFLMLLISINFFLGLFNLVPLLPLDGGHIAIIGYEKVRNTLRARLGKIAKGPVDYIKLMPATYVVLAIMGSYMVLTLSADIINPIKLNF